ncbi:MAG: dTDP-glucose 4,6-dehydratase [Candidatus Binatia bacterium]|nr:MAG: dTDP-glucose 4,6-dehydratase [Candidatus Binatia bacterium]
MKILVTGGAGFIGSNLIRYLLGKHPEDRVVNLDVLTYAGNLENLSDVESNPRYRFVRGDITDEKTVSEVFRDGVDAVVNCAAATHVDRSLFEPRVFVRTNVEGTLVLLEAARRWGVRKFVQVSTDEVYGSLAAEGKFTEDSPLRPSSPYAATKAAADLLALSYVRSFSVPVTVTRCGNNFGPYQFPEKVIPLFITNALEDRWLPLYGDGANVRDWIYVEDHCSGLDLVLREGRPGEVYHIGAENEWTNRELTELILREMGKPASLIRLVEDRPGHDRRYALDTRKIRSELGWQPRHDFLDALRRTIRWYRENRGWWERVKRGEYREYYERAYGERLRGSVPA